MSEARDFIPTGACVEKDAELFAHSATAQLAKAACKSCVQLSYCQEQREVIGAKRKGYTYFGRWVAA